VRRKASKSVDTGFTLIELMVTLTIIGVLASIALPLAEITVQRSKEQELKANLRQIREALDAYKQAVDDGHIKISADESGYPKSLETLVDGMEDLKSPRHTKIYFLRQLPHDPMLSDYTNPAPGSWGKRSFASPRDNPKEGDDVFDVYSLAKGNGLNGIPYREW
jgi:general secretion pathway protein G